MEKIFQKKFSVKNDFLEKSFTPETNGALRNNKQPETQNIC